MPNFRILSTVLNLSESLARRRNGFRGSRSAQAAVTERPTQEPEEVMVDREAQATVPQMQHEDHDDFKLPKITSLVIVEAASALLQISFFIIVSSSNQYSQHLGGTATFSGLVIGIPTVFSGLVLIPLTRLDKGGYTRPLHFACASALLGNILYGLAYYTNFLYLILIGRIVSGFSFTFWMYAKRYCSDPRIVGVRRRTLLAGWLVLGQGGGMTIGPFFGGLLYKIGFSNRIFNGYTSPTWILAGIWAIFWAICAIFFEDVPQVVAQPAIELQPIPNGQPDHKPAEPKGDLIPEPTDLTIQEISADAPTATPSRNSTSSDSSATTSQSQPSHSAAQHVHMSAHQWGVTITMCWFAMTCFFILGAWEANIPVFTGSNSHLNTFHFSPDAAGNLIALGGICTVPFLVVNVFVARRVQDRQTLASGSSLGLLGLLIAIAIMRADRVNYGSYFICWFLIALGFNLASTCTLSLLSKQLPGEWNARISMAIQYSNYTGRVTGAVWGGAGVKVGMLNFVGMQIALVGIGAVMFMTLWRQLKAKTG